MDELKELRKRIVTAAFKAGEGHIASALSILEIVWALYDRILKPHDAFILSKGHGCLALYAVLEKKGLLPQDALDTFGKRDSLLGGHPDCLKSPSFLASTGSLGHGLPMAVGVALARKIKGEPGRVFCLVGDGECNEGTIWESALLAKQHRLNNLIVIVDDNTSSERALNLGSLENKFRAFGFYSFFSMGNFTELVEGSLKKTSSEECDRPRAIIFFTKKGYGVERMINDPAWHHRVPTAQEYAEIMEELS